MPPFGSESSVFRLLYENIKTKRYGTNILSVLLNGCEAWYVTPREKYRIKDFDNSELRTVFRPNSYEVTGECRRLHNEELYDLHTSQNIIREIKSKRQGWAVHVARM